MNESYAAKKAQKIEDQDEATLGFVRVIRHVAGNATPFGGWGPKTRL